MHHDAPLLLLAGGHRQIKVIGARRGGGGGGSRIGFADGQTVAPTFARRRARSAAPCCRARLVTTGRFCR